MVVISILVVGALVEDVDAVDESAGEKWPNTLMISPGPDSQLHPCISRPVELTRKYFRQSPVVFENDETSFEVCEGLRIWRIVPNK